VASTDLFRIQYPLSKYDDSRKRLAGRFVNDSRSNFWR